MKKNTLKNKTSSLQLYTFLMLVDFTGSFLIEKKDRKDFLKSFRIDLENLS
ncbi:MAG: hypothetical protein ACI32O_09165 [Enterococcus sp.]